MKMANLNSATTSDVNATHNMAYLILGERNGKTVTVRADDAYEAETEYRKLESKGYRIVSTENTDPPVYDSGSSGLTE